ncbi:hypothetical protein JOM56_003249 [Amanita muscaria]
MESNQATLTIPDNDNIRHLPSYEEATGPYSLRLPSYRSSYIRRFHPYPRYVTPPPACDSSDDHDDDVLDLSILDHRVRQLPVEREAPVDEQDNDNEQENAGEDGEDEEEDVDVEAVIACDSGGEQLDPIFIKLEVTDTLEVLHID